MSVSAKNKPIPATAGIGLRFPHYHEVIRTLPQVAWFEVHAENFFAKGGLSLHILEQVRQNYPLSLHGVGLSLGSVDLPDQVHLENLKELVDRFNPGLVSEHISWSKVDGIFINDLLPLPYTRESLDKLVENITYTQEYLGRQILIENPSTYLEFIYSEIPEYEFIAEVCKKSGCKVLLDVNNIYVSASNHKFDAIEYINNIPTGIVGEIHLAGHAKREINGQVILIDHHGDYVTDAVWELYSKAISRFGRVPTLIEWDTDIPAFFQLMGEAKNAEFILNGKDSAAS